MAHLNTKIIFFLADSKFSKKYVKLWLKTPHFNTKIQFFLNFSPKMLIFYNGNFVIKKANLDQWQWLKRLIWINGNGLLIINYFGL